MKFLKVAVLFFGLAAAFAVRAQGGTYPVSGRVIDRLSRRPVAYAAVVLAGQEQKGASTDSLGRFRIERVKPGIWRLAVSSVGYKSLTTPEYMVSAATPFIEVELEEDAAQLEAVTVRPSPFRVTAESPVSLKVIGLREIEKSPGSNRDVSRIVRSYPGVAFSPVGYRNDLIVRGGGPAENKFYMDGIEIPNINHFATQGATGGPVSIVNADLVREISFYTGAFPADRAGALSSVLDFSLRDGNAEKQTFKATLGASEVGLSGSAGLYCQLPPYTALGFKVDDALVNRSLDYMRVGVFSAGVDWRLRDRLIVSVEGFYKRYGDVPLSVADGIPLSCKGNDYGVVGNEKLVSSAQGRAYGVEAMARWQIPGRVNVVGSVTVFRSEYRNDRQAPWIASAWDNRFVVNVSGTYDLPRHWSFGAKLSAVGGAPYTPYDVERSSLVEAWDAQGRPYYDYSKYNAGRLDAFAQLDVRIDKVFYFRRCMLGLYIDLQNVAGGRLRQPDVLMSTGEIENPSAPASERRYRMKYLEQVSGTLLPTLGLTVEF